jgi:hypothetical protein
MIDRRHFYPHLISLLLVSLVSIAWRVHAADKLVGLHSAQVMSQSMPWIAQEAGLLRNPIWISS